MFTNDQLFVSESSKRYIVSSPRHDCSHPFFFISHQHSDAQTLVSELHAYERSLCVQRSRSPLILENPERKAQVVARRRT